MAFRSLRTSISVYLKQFDEVCLVFISYESTKEAIYEAVESIRVGG